MITAAAGGGVVAVALVAVVAILTQRKQKRRFNAHLGSAVESQQALNHAPTANLSTASVDILAGSGQVTI